MNEELTLNSRVALLDGADSLYVKALSGTEGWVRDFKTDYDGFELCKIEWDKHHWRYNGQPDCWTYVDHFKVVGPPTEPKEPVDDSSTTELMIQLPPSEPEYDDYMETLTDAMDSASEGDAFVMISITKVPDPENPNAMVFKPEVYTSSVSDEAQMLLNIQLSEVTSAMYSEMVIQFVKAMRKEDGREED